MARSYFHVDYRNSTLYVEMVTKKPRGGAKSALKGIEAILGRETLSQEEKTNLLQVTEKIKLGYCQKNEQSFFLQSLTKRVNDLASSIKTLAIIPEMKADPFLIIAQNVSFKDISSLFQVNKGVNGAVKAGWCLRAESLGWDSKDGVDAAENYCKALKKLCNILKIPDPPLHPSELDKGKWVGLLYQHLSRRRTFIPLHSAKALCQLLLYYSKDGGKTAFLLERQLPRYLSWCTSKKDDELVLLLYQLEEKWQNEIGKLIPVQSVETAKKILSYFPQANLDDLLCEAFTQENVVWIQALLEKRANPNKTIAAYGHNFDPLAYFYDWKLNPSVIRVLLTHKAAIHDPQRFIFRLMMEYICYSPHLRSEIEGIFADIAKRGDNWGHILSTPIKIHGFLTSYKTTYLCAMIAIGAPLDCIKSIIRLGADPNPQNPKFSPLKAAKKHNRSDVETWLLSLQNGPSSADAAQAPGAE